MINPPSGGGPVHAGVACFLKYALYAYPNRLSAAAYSLIRPGWEARPPGGGALKLRSGRCRSHKGRTVTHRPVGRHTRPSDAEKWGAVTLEVSPVTGIGERVL